MIKITPIFLSRVARLALTFCFGILAFGAYAEEDSLLAKPAPSCVNVCYQEKSGKARRGCASICQAEANSCATTGGSYEFQSDKYVCSSSQNIANAKP